MEIRKEFKYEMGHIVRNAWSRRCSKSAHGHSYRVEFLFKGSGGDNGQMLVDFGFLKKYLHPFVDAFDHSFWLWNRKEDAHIIKFFRENFERVIISPYSTTAEMQAKLFATYASAVIEYLKKNDMFENGEAAADLYVSSVRVHETTTGYAEYVLTDLGKFPDADLQGLIFSAQIWDEWPVEFQQFYTALVPSINKLPLYLELTARQTGKTSRLIKSVIDWVKNGSDAVVYVANHRIGECLMESIIPKLQEYQTKGGVYVVKFDKRKIFLAHKKLNNPRYFYDEFDLFQWKDEDIIEDGAYMTTTPKYIRTNDKKIPGDPIQKALRKSGGTFWGQMSTNTNYPLNERGVVFAQNGQYMPDPNYFPMLSKERTFYSVNLE